MALNRVTLHIEPGEMVSIVGPSGSGKSTLLNIIGCLDRPTSGEVSIGGQQLAAMHDDDLTRVRRDKIGFIFQFFNLLAHANGHGKRRAAAASPRMAASQGARSRARTARSRADSANASNTFRRSSRGANGNASRLRARSRCNRPFCSATSPPETWTRKTGVGDPEAASGPARAFRIHRGRRDA